jgi:hypothetical protein
VVAVVALEPLAPTATLEPILLVLAATVSRRQSRVQRLPVLAVAVAAHPLGLPRTVARVVAVTALLGQAVSVVLAQQTRAVVAVVPTVLVALVARAQLSSDT